MLWTEYISDPSFHYALKRYASHLCCADLWSYVLSKTATYVLLGFWWSFNEVRCVLFE